MIPPKPTLLEQLEMLQADKLMQDFEAALARGGALLELPQLLRRLESTVFGAGARRVIARAALHLAAKYARLYFNSQRDKMAQPRSRLAELRDHATRFGYYLWPELDF